MTASPLRYEMILMSDRMVPLLQMTGSNLSRDSPRRSSPMMDFITYSSSSSESSDIGYLAISKGMGRGVCRQILSILSFVGRSYCGKLAGETTAAAPVRENSTLKLSTGLATGATGIRAFLRFTSSIRFTRLVRSPDSRSSRHTYFTWSCSQLYGERCVF